MFPFDFVNLGEARDVAPFGPSRRCAAAAGPENAATLGAERDVPVVLGERLREVFSGNLPMKIQKKPKKDPIPLESS